VFVTKITENVILGLDACQVHVMAANMKHRVLQLGEEVVLWGRFPIISHKVIMTKCESCNCLLVGPSEVANSLKVAHQYYFGSTLVRATLKNG
jgi:hypothetical protein